MTPTKEEGILASETPGDFSEGRAGTWPEDPYEPPADDRAHVASRQPLATLASRTHPRDLRDLRDLPAFPIGLQKENPSLSLSVFLVRLAGEVPEIPDESPNPSW